MYKNIYMYTKYLSLGNSTPLSQYVEINRDKDKAERGRKLNRNF